MKSNQTRNTKVIVRGAAAGAITKADVERRARELALIRGVPHEISEQDREQARRELLEGTGPSSTISDEAQASAVVTRDPSEPPDYSADAGPGLGEKTDDEEGMVERLALQGVEEAQHDQMVEARKRRPE